MKKQFLFFSMLLMGLLTLGTIARAEMTPSEAKANAHWAILTAKPASSTGGEGWVFVDTAFVEKNAAAFATESTDSAYVATYSLTSVNLTIPHFKSVYAKSKNGSYFAGWSFSDGGTEKTIEEGTTENPNAGGIELAPSVENGVANARRYDLFAAFKPVRLTSYTIVKGSQIIDANNQAADSLVIIAEADRENGIGLQDGTDYRHFKLPVITPKSEEGTWTVNIIEAGSWAGHFRADGGTARLSVKVTFTAPDNNPRDYAATLTIETYAGRKLNIPLYARKPANESNKAILYHDGTKSAIQDVGTAYSNAVDGDTIKLAGGCNQNITIAKEITLDLNGYEWTNSLTTNDGDVTLAYSPFGGTITGAVTVSSGKLIANGGTLNGAVTVANGAELVANGATFAAIVTNNGTTTVTEGALTAGITSAGTLNVNGGAIRNTSGIAVSVTAGTANINRGTISGSTYGVKVTGGTTTIEKLAAIAGNIKALNGAGGAITVNNGKFEDPSMLSTGTMITFNAGYFKTNDAEEETVYGKPIWRNTAGTEFREGYTLFAGSQEAAHNSGVGVCRINQTSYTTLEDALAYVNNNPNQQMTIFMVNDYTLPAGNYTIPAKATLVVPKDSEQNTANPTVEHTSIAKNRSYNQPEAFITLTFATGVDMKILGALEVTCVEACQVSNEMQSIPDGPYGHLVLQEGSKITLSAGSELRAWGFITGNGEIDARRGSVVREQFQIGDWKGGNISYTMINGNKPQKNLHLFPIYSYFIQNIESPVTYHPGSELLCSVAVEVSGNIRAYADDIKVVGVLESGAMFLMDKNADAENTWVRKRYDAATDQQVYEVNSGAKLGSMIINLGEIAASLIQPGNTDIWTIIMDSRKFVLPLTSNFKIHLLSGQMEFTQSTACLPGTEIEVDKESTISIVKNTDTEVYSGALYFYDAEQWGNYLHGNKCGSIVNYSATVHAANPDGDGKPDVRNVDTPADLGDAKLIVHGTFQMRDGCAVYTTAGKKLKSSGGDEYVYEVDLDAPGGASITSTNLDAGTFVFLADAAKSHDLTVTKSGTHLTSIGDEEGNITEDVLINYDGYSDEAWRIKPVITKNNQTANFFNYQLCTSARLKNSDESFINTYTDDEHYALANDAYCFIDDRWRILKVDEDNGCFMADMADPYHPQYYAKPQEYVAINATKDANGIFSGNDDHTFSDTKGEGRLFILISDPVCQWWEVVNENNLYHCTHPKNNTYYYWDEDEEAWMEKRFTITWKNWDGTVLTTIDKYGNPTENYSVTYGTPAEYFGSTPSRPANIDYTYDFVGWSPALGNVTQDVVYTAVYKKNPRKYTVIFQTEGGEEIERQLLGHNEVPVCENVPTRAGFTLQWSPAIAAVTGDAVYSATWLPEPPTAYEITFVDYDGDVENHTILNGPVAVGCMPEPPAIVDGKPDGAEGKPATPEFTYVFDHWSPNVSEVTQAMTYTAVYREEAILYTVIFKNEDGSEIERHQYAYGETPVCSGTPTKPTEEGYTYTLMWDPQIQTVMGPETYTADYQTLKTKNKYSVKAKCSPAAAAIMTGNGVYEHNATATLGFTAATGFYFEKWSDEVTTPTRTMPVTSNIELTAIFTNEAPVNYTITWKNEDGLETLQEETQPAGATSYTGTTPTKPATSSATYEFDGWTTEPNGAGTYYKNGMTPDATADATYYAHFKVVANPDIEIGVGQIRTLTEETTCEDLIITSDGVNSGQLAGAGFLTLTGHAHFDYAIDAQPRTWYQVAVPWQVDATTGISVNGHQLTLGKDFDVVFYSGARRAVEGKNRCWEYIEHHDKKMYPGKLYMILLMGHAPVIRFTKEDGAPILTTITSVETYTLTTGNDDDANWNGLANPALFYAYVNAGEVTYEEPGYGQVYNPAISDFDLLPLTDKFIVGQGAFVQVPAANPEIHVTSAPRRWAATNPAIDSKYEVRLAPINKPYTDRVIVTANETKKEDIYVIGKDLTKLGANSESVVPRMWVNRYNTTLCVNTIKPVDGNAEYPLGIYVPETGAYTLCIKYGAVSDTQSDLYLTLDGQAIWNLSRNAYTVELEQGTTERYGLRLRAKAPQSTQAIDEIIVDSKDDTATKVLINDQVFIIRGGEVYTLTGNKVK